MARPRVSGELPILLGLAAAAGLVDAASYLALGHVFTANMTGNLVLLGFAVAGAHEFSVPRSLVALGAYLAGALCGARVALAADRTAGTVGRAGGAAFGIEPVVLLAAVLIASVGWHVLPNPSVRGYALVALAALAMGARNGAARKLGIPHVATTVVTTNLARLAADSRLGGGYDRDWPKLAASACAMFAGAVLGAWLLRYSLAAPLGCGVLLSAGCAMLAHSLCEARQSMRRGH